MRPCLIGALFWAGCGRPPPRLVLPRDTGEPISAHDTDAEPADTDSSAPPPPPYLTELLHDGGFEGGDYGAWLPTGCALSQGEDGRDPAEGDWLLYGGPSDCVAEQRLDLDALGFSADAIDAGGVQVSAAGWVANRYPALSFDDQVFFQLRFLSEDGAPLGALETLLGAGEAWTLREVSAGLPPGTRQIQVMVGGVHRQGLTNESAVDAISVMLSEQVPQQAALTLPPMLQDHRTDQMQVVWETDRADHAARIEWSAAGGPLAAAVSDTATVHVADDHYVHRGVISGLEAGTAYDYRACVGAVCSETHTFRTAPDARAPVRLGWLADNQDNFGDVFEVHVANMQARDLDLLVMAGDVVQDGDLLSEWSELWWAPLTGTGFASSVPVLIARGNHDKEHPYAYAYAAMPGNGAWYSFRYGEVFVVVLDSNYGALADNERLSQARFLQDTLASEEAKDAAFQIVVFHAAPFNAITTGDSLDGQTTGPSWGWEDGQANLVPLFSELGVDLVVAGHYHSYQRGARDGVRYVVVGGGGASLLGGEIGGPYEEMWAHIEASWHYAVMDADSATLTWTTYGVDDEIIDQFSVTAP